MTVAITNLVLALTLDQSRCVFYRTALLPAMHGVVVILCVQPCLHDGFTLRSLGSPV